ncbi:polysaccharide biosynthesis protein [Sphingomonas sp.]|jgi:UDP-glucose 4-epimerase|uniref:polysaccharide biosynthesis protein n=1 Tax=Sphingomonas sp. TaxID=28214 RepID=UPI002E30DA2E|nr:polysaccharide biosynthesis protein [Sphingomonas sp.]HEX4695450.1 polysaccharide biosynthesis protein [Sphingomonas sp.]
MGDFAGKTLMITGGTGSFGTTMLDQFLKQPIAEIRIVSRDEKKQEDQRLRFADPRIKYHIADVRDARTIEMISRGVDFIYHAAALKQVPSCEFHPMEAVATNVTGTANVLDAAIRNGVKRVVCLSTDKAVYPVNAMGMSKALMEKVAIAKSRSAEGSDTVISATRYGNVLASRGSVVPLFMRQVSSGQPITLTDPGMTRFVMTLDEAVDLCLYAFDHGENGDLFVQKAAAITIEKLAHAVLAVMDRRDHPIRVIGTRHGEKQHETLLSREEMAVAEDCDSYYRVAPDGRDLNYDAYFSDGREKVSRADDFNSLNTRQLEVEELADILRTLPYVRGLLAGEAIDES